MLAVIIADSSFARREHAMLARLEIGLADEGVRVVHAVPQSVLQTETAGLYSTVVGYQDMGLSISRRLRAGRLAHAIRDAVGDEAATDVSVVHAFGVNCWNMALDLARIVGAGVLLEVWRSSLIGRAANLANARPDPLPHFCVSEPSVSSALRKRAGRALIHTAPWGVHTPDSVRPTFDRSRTLGVAVLSDSGDAKAAAAALGGLKSACRDLSDTLIFLGAADVPPSREAGLWSVAERLDLLPSLTAIPDMEARREPILQMDMLLIPEAAGRERSLALEAMASGMVVIAAADPLVSSLVDGQTARVVRSSTPTAWETAIRSVTDSPDAWRSLAASGREFVRSRRSASAQIGEILKAYAEVSSVRV